MAQWTDDILGWRARIGLILPSTNLLLETALPRMAPEGVTFHAARVRSGGSATPDALREMAAHDLEAARNLATAKVDLVAYCCTASSFIEGKSHDDKIRAAITEATGIPVSTTMRAIVDALRSLSARRIVVVSPYAARLEELEVRYLADDGFEIVASAAMGITDMLALHDPAPSEIYRLARRTWTANADALLISCNALRAHVVAAALESDIGRPVVTSLTATLWAALRTLRIGEPVRSYGTLLEQPR